MSQRRSDFDIGHPGSTRDRWPRDLDRQRGRPVRLTVRVPSGAAPVRDGIPVSARLQILATEHWSLLATRSLTWNESFSRSSMFLSILSGAVIALALAAQATSFGPGFLGFALVVLPVVLFIGLATFVRLVAVNQEDMLWVQGMNRLRRAYLELAPDLEPYLVAAAHDDEAGVMTTLGASPGTHGWYHHVLVTTPAVVGLVAVSVAGTIAALIATGSGFERESSIAIGVATFVSLAVSLTAYQRRAFRASQTLPSVRFPTPEGELRMHHH
jgi:hypothetical protein